MIRVAINGYGNLGRGVEQAITKNADMEVAVVFTRRDPATVTTQGAPVAHVDDMASWTDKVDVCLNCGGSATDLIEQTPAATALFHTVDSFDTHARIPEHFAAVDAAAKASGHVALISTGWDPGLFSMLRVLGEAVLPDGATTTFWGPGVSQGHSDALRRIDGVVDAKQYTRPVEATVAAVKAGDDVELLIGDGVSCQGPDQLELLVASGLGRPSQLQQPVGRSRSQFPAHGRGQETGQAGGDASQQPLDDRGVLLHTQRPQGRVKESGGGKLAVAHHVPGRC